MAQILLVDDDTNVLLTLAIALRRQGHTVTVAQNGWQAVALLRQYRYSVLISDVRMPGMSGIELADWTRHLDDAPKIILTSALDSELAEGAADAFVPKPVDIRQLNSILALEARNAALLPQSKNAEWLPAASPR